MPRKYPAAALSGKQSRKIPSSKEIPQPSQSTSARESVSSSSGGLQLVLDREEMVGLLQDTLHSFAVEVGLRVAHNLLTDEVDRLCGPRSQHNADRTATRYGKQPGVITIAGQKLPVDRPRVRSVDNKAEVPLEIYAQLQQDDAMPEAALKRMVHGVSCRDYEKVVDLARDAFGVKRSSVSRAFVKATAEQVASFAERRFADQRFLVIFIDGVEYAGEMMIVALGVLENGVKQILGIRQGATENAAVTTQLLVDLSERGIDTSMPTLFVLDGAKALHAAVKRVWGNQGIIQRCQVHKRRNVDAHVPDRHKDELARRLKEAYSEKHFGTARSRLEGTVRWLSKINQDAAASLEEGMEETLTITRLGIGTTLRRTFSTTNSIESALSMARRVTGRVTRWRDGDMRHRWCTAALLAAEKRMRRVKGFRELGKLVEALESYVSKAHSLPCKLA